MQFADWLDQDMKVESGYARVRRMLFGDVPQIRTIGIITAQNPQGTEGTNKENEERNKHLYSYLQSANYGPIKAQGKYGGLPEDSFIVPNITKEELIQLGQQYDQETVIWGQKETDQFDNPYFNFEFIKSDTGEVLSARSVHMGGEDIQSRNDLYTMIKRRKLVIPFFGDPHRRKVPGEKRGTVRDVPVSAATPWSDDDLARKVRKLETFHIPFFDDPEDTTLTDLTECDISYYSNRLPKTPLVKKLVDDIQISEAKLWKEGFTGKHYWIHRGIIRENLWKINTLHLLPVA